MTRSDDITTDRDPRQRLHRASLMGLVWLAVYPAVTLLSYLTGGLEVPVFVRTFMTTIATVPLITFIVVPYAKKAIRRVDPKA